MYVAANRHLVHKVDLAQNRVVATADVSNDGWDRLMFGFVVDPDGKTGYGAFMSRKTDKGEVVIGKPVVAQFELATGKLLRSVEVPWGVAHLVSVKGGKTLYAFGKDLYKIDTTGSDLKVVETVPMFDKGMNILPFWDYAFDNGGVASMNYYTREVHGAAARRPADRRHRATSCSKGEPAMAYSVVLAPDRKKAYAVMDDLTVIDLAKKTYLASVPIAEGTCYGVNVSADGRKIYVARRRVHADRLRRADAEAAEGAADGLRRHGPAPAHRVLTPGARVTGRRQTRGIRTSPASPADAAARSARRVPARVARACCRRGPRSRCTSGPSSARTACPTSTRPRRSARWRATTAWEPTLLTPLVTPEGLRHRGPPADRARGERLGASGRVQRLGRPRAPARPPPVAAAARGPADEPVAARPPRLSRCAGRQRNARRVALRRDCAGSSRGLGVAAIETDADLDGGYLGDGPDDDGRRALDRALHFPSPSPRRAAAVR